MKALREEIKTLDRKKDSVRVAQIDKAIVILKQYPAFVKQAKRKATLALAKQHRRRVELIRRANSPYRRKPLDFKKTLDAYLALMQIDPFLAQTVGDESSKLIKEFRNRLSIVKVDSELETNITYDIQMVKLKHEINQLELELMQDAEAIALLTAGRGTIACPSTRSTANCSNRSRELFIHKHQLALERLTIERGELFANEHLKELVETNNLHRRYLTEATGTLVQGIRRRESHEVYVAEAKNDLDLLLKEYDMKALYFQTIYENELSFFVSQKMRIEAENEIHAQFVLTTYAEPDALRRRTGPARQSGIPLPPGKHSCRSSTNSAATSTTSSSITTSSTWKNATASIEEYQATLYASNHLSEARPRTPSRKTRFRRPSNPPKPTTTRRSPNSKPPTTSTRSSARPTPSSTSSTSRSRTAIADAERIRDVTIAEYGEVYHKAKDRYDTLEKPYFDKKINIMDPVFLERYEAMQTRLQTAKKDAEAELERLAAPKLQHYLEVYYENADEPDLQEYRLKIPGARNGKGGPREGLQGQARCDRPRHPVADRRRQPGARRQARGVRPARDPDRPEGQDDRGRVPPSRRPSSKRREPSSRPSAPTRPQRSDPTRPPRPTRPSRPTPPSTRR
ncbi:MAG: hypothetical protein MZU79_05980 [Anaerotruncus sp.]|nr:hypothetical protein [Anaerotruncus sp.]